MWRRLDESATLGRATPRRPARPGRPSAGRLLRRPALLTAVCLTVAALAAATAVQQPAASAAAPARAPLRVPPTAQGLWDGGDNWEICHGSRLRTQPLDYAIGDIQRRLRTTAARAAYVRQVNRCADRRRVVYLRPMHEINGSWYPWSSRTPAQYRRDFCALKRFWKGNSTRREWSRVRWVEGLNHGTSPRRGRPGDYHAACADVIGVSMYLHTGDSWALWTGPGIGILGWQRFAAARYCGSMFVRHHRGERIHRCGIAASEWGVEDGWHDDSRDDVTAYRRSLAWMSRWVYQAPLCGDGTPWISLATGRPCGAVTQ
jgi:hypothetical protein